MKEIVFLSLAFASVLASCKKEGCTDLAQINEIKADIDAKY